MVSVLAWVIFHAPLAHAKTDTRFLLYQKKPVSENCNCFQSTISKIAVILSQSFPKGYNFLLYADRAHCANRKFWENRVNSKIFSGYFRFEFLILKLIAQTFTNQFFVKRLPQNIQFLKILKSLFFLFKMFKMLFKISDYHPIRSSRK